MWLHDCWYFKPKFRERERENSHLGHHFADSSKKGAGLEGAVKLIFTTSCQRQTRLCGRSVQRTYQISFWPAPNGCVAASASCVEWHRTLPPWWWMPLVPNENNSREAIQWRSTQRETAKSKSKLASYYPCNLLASIAISIPRCDGQYHEGFLDFVCRIDRHFLRKHDCCWQFNS